MAADNEVRLVSKVVIDRNIAPAIEKGVQASWFVDDESRAVYDFVWKHWGKYNQVPTITTVKANFPTYRILNVQDSLDYLVDQLIAYRRRQAAILLVQDAAAVLENDPDPETAITLMTRRLSLIGDTGVTEVREVDVTEDAQDRWAEYEQREQRAKSGQVLLGIPTGFQTIDEASGGLQGGQLIVIVATPKTGKSVLLMQIAANVHDLGYSTWFQSFEMSNEAQITRHDALRAHISHTRLTRGQLDMMEKQRYQRSLKRLDKMTNPFILADSVHGQTVSAIQSKVEALNPDVVFIDGTYLMIDEITGEQNTPQALTNITRSLHKMALRLDKPIVISTQALEWKMKGNKLETSSIGYSSSFFQDCDLLLGLQKGDEDNDPDGRVLRVLGGRNCSPTEVDLTWDWNSGQFAEYQAAP